MDKVWINKGLLAFSSGIQSKEQIEYDLSYDLAAITPEPEIGTEMKIIFTIKRNLIWMRFCLLKSVISIERMESKNEKKYSFSDLCYGSNII